jgi:pyruvate/2-oxoglutarate dehydrogenase complex dihydrolipoamide acyltransferase (E2) component
MPELELRLQKFGMTMQEATIEEWLVAVGDAVEEGQDIAVISTDKVESSLPSPAAGTVARILVEAGESVTPGTLLAVIRALS